MGRGEGLGLTPVRYPRRLTAVDLVRESLRSAILRGDLPGDARLIQTDIAAQLEVSTTPVREAMRDLASEGLITLDSHRIGTVRKPDWDEMLEIVQLRRTLERDSIERWMTKISEEDINDARSLAEQLTTVEDIGTWVQGNIQFHSIFHRATATRRMGTFLVALESAGGVFVAQAQRLQPEIRERAVADHFLLLDAYEKRDVDAACEIQYGHVNLPLVARTNPAG